MLPKISVVLAVKNGAKWCVRCLGGLQSQTFEDFEVVLVNDGSTDDTQNILNSFVARDSRFRIHRLNTSVGLASALNIGVGLTRAEIIARQDIDDISLPNRLEQQYKHLEKSPEIGLLGCGYADVSSDLRIIRENRLEYSVDQCRQELIRRNYLCHSGVIFRKGIFNSIGGYDPSFPYAQDYRLYFQFARNSAIAVIPEVLVYQTRHDSAVSFRKIRMQRYYAVKARLMAIRAGQYGWGTARYVVLPLLANLLPLNVKTGIDRFRFGA